MDTRQTLESNVSPSVDMVRLEAVPPSQYDDPRTQLFIERMKQRFSRPSTLVLLAILVGAILLLIALLPSLFPSALALLKDGIGVLLYLILVLLIGLLALQLRQARREIVASQRRLFTAEERLRIGLKNSFITVYQQDRDLRYTWMANPLRVFSPDDVVGKMDADFVTPEEAAHLTQIKQRVLQTGESVMEEVRTTSVMGVRFAELRVEPLQNSNGTIVGVTGTAIDVTERKRFEEERRSFERRTQETLDALLTLAEELVQLPAQTGEPADAYDIARRLAELIRRTLNCQRAGLTAFDEESGTWHSLAVVGLTTEQEQAWRKGQPGTVLPEIVQGEVLEAIQKSGEVQIIDFTRSSIAEQSNPYNVQTLLLAPLKMHSHLIGMITLDYDKTHTYTPREVALAKAVAELATLILERERLLAERAEAESTALAAQTSTRLMEEFLGTAGHELRTPLTSIKASVQLAKRQLLRIHTDTNSFSSDAMPLLGNIRKLLERAERQTNVQSRLVDDLLDVSRIQIGRLEVYPERHGIVALIRQVVEDQQDENSNRTINIEVPLSGEILVMADSDRVRQVLSNYLSNALKYSEPTTPVTVQIEREPDASVVRVSVRDEGPGLSAEQQQRIWERFYRVPDIDVKSGSGVGLGLGLHICHTLIERQGGSVGVQSEPGHGSTFWFTLPVAIP